MGGGRTIDSYLSRRAKLRGGRRQVRCCPRRGARRPINGCRCLFECAFLCPEGSHGSAEVVWRDWAAHGRVECVESFFHLAFSWAQICPRFGGSRGAYLFQYGRKDSARAINTPV
ncbi:hypothetical protein BD311DRAFT_763394 [Dichomitus squalens]|uniref:Uncharacterized protein n=1 Tax=Dichomitus squalens TaxID=114155 RepID=A0A4Q9MFC3_9APHY|nr:hypothetical protein BD311DRAFT_763394 [Dichomitus squalens]